MSGQTASAPALPPGSLTSGLREPVDGALLAVVVGGPSWPRITEFPWTDESCVVGDDYRLEAVAHAKPSGGSTRTASPAVVSAGLMPTASAWSASARSPAAETSSDRQLRIFNANRDIREVVEEIAIATEVLPVSVD